MYKLTYIVFQDGENGQIKIEHLSDQDVNQDQFQESNSDLILDRTRAEPRNHHNNANTNTNTFEEKTTVIRPLPQDIIVSIKDENSRSSTCSSHVFTNLKTTNPEFSICHYLLFKKKMVFGTK
jgi:hypothetical protein